jgi:serine/threonine protein kinase
MDIYSPKKLSPDLLQDEGDLFIMRNSRVAQATSKVYLDAFLVEEDTRFSNKFTPVVVKVMKSNISRRVLFYETLINILVDFYTRGSDIISAPKIYRLGLIRKRERYYGVLVQEYIEAEEFSNLDSLTNLQNGLKQCCKGLSWLYNTLRFSHRDFHSGNVMYDIKNNRVILIDFGYSCITLPDTSGSIQIKKNIYGWDLDDPVNTSLVACKNRSHDICTLILALYHRNSLFRNRYYGLCKSICNAYRREIYSKYPDPNAFLMDISNNLGWISPKIDEPVFHFWHMYELYDIEVEEFIPEEVYKILEIGQHFGNLKL